MKTILPITVGSLIAVVSGWQHGLLIDRWGPPSHVVEVADQLENLQLEVPGWTSKALEGIDDRTRKLAGAEGYFSRQYLQERSGIAVQVTILCGRPGPISLHSPEYCFTLAGMKQLGSASEASLFETSPESSKDFWMADYRPPDSKSSPDIRTFWSWSDDGVNWTIPENPRFEFASVPYLYRIYFTMPKQVFEATVSDEEIESKNAIIAKEFMEEFLTRCSEAIAARKA